MALYTPPRTGLPGCLLVEEIANDLMTDVGGAFYTIRAVLPAMLARRAGTILLSGGGLAVDPSPLYLTLSVGKAGLRALARALSKDPVLADIHVAHALLHTTITPEAGREIAEEFWTLANEAPEA